MYVRYVMPQQITTNGGCAAVMEETGVPISAPEVLTGTITSCSSAPSEHLDMWF